MVRVPTNHEYHNYNFSPKTLQCLFFLCRTHLKLRGFFFPPYTTSKSCSLFRSIQQSNNPPNRHCFRHTRLRESHTGLACSSGEEDCCNDGSLHQWLKGCNGVNGVPLLYIVHPTLTVSPSITDPSTNYKMIQDELITSTPIQDDAGNFTLTYLSDCATVWEKYRNLS